MNRWRRDLILVLLVFMLDLIPMMVQWAWGISDPALNQMIRKLQIIWLMALCALLGGSAAVTRHPANVANYRQWLLATPWRPGLPLPLGRLTPDLGEHAVLTVIVVITVLHLHIPAVLPLLVFALGCIIPATITLSRTGPELVALTLWFGLALVVRVATQPMLMFAVAAVLYAFAVAGLDRSMRQFPWGMDVAKLPKPALGPVLDRLGPRGASPYNWAASVLLVLGVAWWAYCVLTHVVRDAPDGGAGFVFAASAVMACFALIRLLAYCGMYHPPISLWGRIRTGRLIVPGYDYVLVTPIVAGVIAAALPHLLLRAGASPAVAIAGAGVVVMLILLLGRPTLSHWQLTGHHRIVLTGSK